MRAKSSGSCVAVARVLAMLSAASVPVTGQQPNEARRGQAPTTTQPGSIPRTADGRPDMRGRWTAPPLLNSNIVEEHSGGFGIQAGKSLVVDPPDGVIPYQPWALAQRNENRRPENAYLDNEGKCMVSGVPRVMFFSFEIVYAPRHIALMFEPNYHGNRIISMDARKHLPDGIRLYMGDPIGRWEGDTLVADSTNFNGKVWFALGGDFATDALHIVERFTMTDSNTLKWTATLTDPKAYTRPWTMTNGAPYVRARGGDEWLEDTCHEGNADLVHLKNLYDAAHKARGR